MHHKCGPLLKIFGLSKFFISITLVLFLIGCISMPKLNAKYSNGYQESIKSYDKNLKAGNIDGALANLDTAKKNITADGALKNGKGEFFKDEAWVVATEGHLEFNKGNVHGAIAKWKESFDIEYNGLTEQQSVAVTNARITNITNTLLAGLAGALNQASAKASAKPGSTYTYEIPSVKYINVPTPKALEVGLAQNTILRVPVRVEGAPFNNIIKLSTDKNSCTATMVSKRVAISAAHCLSSDGSAISPALINLNKLSIFPQLDANKVIKYYTHQGENAGWDTKRGNDWVILVTDSSFVANNNGPENIFPKVLKVIPPDLQSGNSKLMLAGYSSDLNGGYYLTLAFGCKMKQGQKLGGGTYYTNCENAKGSSGAAIMTTTQPYSIVGIHTAQITIPTHEYYSVETFSDYFTNLVGKVISMY
jgi:hypothetical protein